MDLSKLEMRLGLGQFNEITEEQISFIKQLGVEDILLNLIPGSPHLPGETHWEYIDLVQLRTRCDEAGLRLMALEKRAL